MYPVQDSQLPRQQEDVYAMTPPAGNGKVVVFANFTGELTGYNKDIDKIEEFFQHKLKYPAENILIYKNLCRREFMEKMTEIQASLNARKDTERLYLFILSHGSTKGVMMCQQGSDSNKEGDDGNPVSDDDIFKLLEHDNLMCLKDKPKLVFIQTCRGTGVLQSAAKPVFTEQNQPAAASNRTPLGADMLISYSTMTNYKDTKATS